MTMTDVPEYSYKQAGPEGMTLAEIQKKNCQYWGGSHNHDNMPMPMDAATTTTPMAPSKPPTFGASKKYAGGPSMGYSQKAQPAPPKPKQEYHGYTDKKK